MKYYIGDLEVELRNAHGKTFFWIRDAKLDVLVELHTEDMEETLRNKRYNYSFISLANRLVETYGNPEVIASKKQKAEWIADYLLCNLDQLEAILVKEIL